jgi:hypothetical protein
LRYSIVTKPYALAGMPSITHTAKNCGQRSTLSATAALYLAKSNRAAIQSGYPPTTKGKEMKEYTVIVNTQDGAHFDCETLAEAIHVFDSAPVAATGERLLTIDGIVARREFFEIE